MFHISDEALAQYGLGDPAATAIIGVLPLFGPDPRHSSRSTNKVMELLAGELGRHARLADAKASAPEIERFLMETAPIVGVRVGGWSRGDGHALAVVRIEAASRTVFYTNPWNEGRVRAIAISDPARQASGTRADLEPSASDLPWRSWVVIMSSERRRRRIQNVTSQWFQGPEGSR